MDSVPGLSKESDNKFNPFAENQKNQQNNSLE